MKVNLGSGRVNMHGFVNVDKTQIVDGNGNTLVDYIVDLEKQALPFEDNSVEEIVADDVLEHLYNLQGVMNECHRVLKEGGILRGHVPVCGTKPHYKDPTHVRCFIKETFAYFCGESLWKKGAPSKPKYADYGFLAWDHIEPLEQKDDLIYFKLRPRK